MSDVETTWSHEFTQEQVDAWKAKYKHIWTMKVSLSEYVYRGLTNAEFELLRSEELVFTKKLESEGKSPDEIAQLTVANSMKAVVLTCVLFPEDYAGKISGDLAGVVELLQPAILDASGFPSEQPEITSL